MLLYGSGVGKELLHVKASASPTKRKSKAKDRRKGRDRAESAQVNAKGKGKARDYLMEGGDDEDGTAVIEQASGSDIEQDQEVAWEAEAYVTGVNYHVKKMVFLLFINSVSSLIIKGHALNPPVIDRLVESSRIKRAIEAVYNSILPKGTCPFVYLRCECVHCQKPDV